MPGAALGPEGTFSHELAVRLFPDGVQLFSTLDRVCAAVESAGLTGVVPLENSEAGGVGPAMDAVSAHHVFLIGEVYLPIHHHLAAYEPESSLRLLFAHPQTHEQCSRVLEELGLEVIHTASNAASAVRAREYPHAGAILSRAAAERYGIPIIRAHIENSPDNTTRFGIISPEPDLAGPYEKCSIIVDPAADRTGLLYDLLGVFARRGINLTRIESHPSRRGIGNYIFFIDLATSPGWNDALAELSRLARVRTLGCYRKREVSGWI